MRSALAVTVAAFALLGCGTSPEFIDDVAEPDDVAYVSPRPARTSGLVGRWTGIGYQSNGSQWEMILDVTSLERGPCAIVRYPSIGCAGYWQCTSASRGRIDALERITEGKGKCVDKAEVNVTLDAGGRMLSFYAEADDQTAMGELSPAR